MYIDVALIDDFKKRYGYRHDLELFIENCGVWFPSIEKVREEWEEPDATLEEICSVYYFIVDGDNILFTPPSEFWEDADEFIKEMEE